ncbi:pyruvate dehydrogenase E1 component subunit alpha, testis-specific form, mitochondrial [Diachasma alloeum]|uniref:pyruvate dehydrogenase E1 component subunit alpha, testis-specific form, mitochondrial n=1 Tax=Diachasma alloeum TaxID=454923 RepID=UPI000738137F|nr:pyruvate dehydrogenase E1 component subunit alpha, testis-specific form, mitochondrial [Diachasma alloeum]
MMRAKFFQQFPPFLLRYSTNAVSKTATMHLKYEHLYKLEKPPAESSTISLEEATTALKMMMYIRRMERKAAELYLARLINGFLHLYSGQEAVAVGLKMSLDDGDSVITAYRCHGIACVFGVSARDVLAELMGRKTGVASGKGGSMHMYAKGFYGGDGIVGGQVPIGAGIAFAHKYKGEPNVCFALYGDGAASQGQIHEAWNMSKLWNLPAVFICENNRYGMGTSVDRHSANPAFYTRGDCIPGIKANGMNLLEVREVCKFARDHALKSGPIILEFETYRYFGHSMSDPGTAYRTREEIKGVQESQDPIELFIKFSIDQQLMTEPEVAELRKSTNKQVDAELEQAKVDPWPEPEDIASSMYVKPLEKARGKIPWEFH